MGQTLPTFLFIGADKSGSTWLYNVLRGHPRCFVPRLKDIYFFDRHYSRGLDWYARFFVASPAEAVAVGELSHDYLYSSVAAERIFRDLPAVRLVAFLRDPAERCFSEYLYLVRNGRTRNPFRQALDESPEILEHSRYARHLGAYMQLFGPERLRIFFFEDLLVDPRKLAAQVLDFLGLEWVDSVDIMRNPLPAGRARSRVVARAVSGGANAARRLGLPGAVGAVKTSRWVRPLYVPYEPRDRPCLKESDRSYLSEQLNGDTEELRRLIGAGTGPAWLHSCESEGME